MEFLIILLIQIGIIVWTGRIAARKDRSTVGWVLLAICFGLFALIIVACLSDRNEDRRKLAAATRALG